MGLAAFVIGRQLRRLSLGTSARLSASEQAKPSHPIADDSRRTLRTQNFFKKLSTQQTYRNTRKLRSSKNKHKHFFTEEVQKRVRSASPISGRFCSCTERRTHAQPARFSICVQIARKAFHPPERSLEDKIFACSLQFLCVFSCFERRIA